MSLQKKPQAHAHVSLGYIFNLESLNIICSNCSQIRVNDKEKILLCVAITDDTHCHDCNKNMQFIEVNTGYDYEEEESEEELDLASELTWDGYPTDDE